jgi:midasin (ATPase involved in ribosome maturation)
MAEMNFLERSASRRGIKASAFGGSVGVQLFEFLWNIRKVVKQWLDENSQGFNQTSLTRIWEALDLWRDLVQLGSATDLNESVFHVYLSLFEKWVGNATKELPQSCVSAAQSALQAFQEPLQLTTGLSMEKMWVALRPSVPKSLVAWEQYLLLKGIMERFDNIRVEGGLLISISFA